MPVRAPRPRTGTAAPPSAAARPSPRPGTLRRAVAFLAAASAVVAGMTGLVGGLTSQAATTTTTMWSSTTVPKVPADADRSSVEIGTVFSTSAAGSVTALRFYGTSANVGPHVGTLWDAQGRALATATFATTTSSGWRQAALSKPVNLVVGQRYTVSYRAPQGRYAGDHGVFSSGRTVRNGSLTASAGVYTYGSGRPTQTYQGSAYYVDVAFTPPAPAPRPRHGRPPLRPRPRRSRPRTHHPTPTTAPAMTGWPTAANTGVPTGTTLSPYTGPCTITAAGTVIDAKTISCSLDIRASGVKITRSLINGTVGTGENTTGYSFSISDSEVRIGAREGTGVGAVNFTATRVHVNGGNRSMHCYRDCVIQDSYVHGQYRDATGRMHESGIRMGSGATIRHNSITCDAPDVPPDAGCSAGLTGYGDFAPVQNNVVEKQPVQGHHRRLLRLRRVVAGQALLLADSGHRVPRQRLRAWPLGSAVASTGPSPRSTRG